MRPTADDPPTFRHELVLHSSTEEMLEFVVPFVREGIAAEEPTLLLLRPETAATVLHRVGSSPYLTLLPALGRPGRPASDLRATDALLAGLEPGTPRVRVVNQEPAVPETHTPRCSSDTASRSGPCSAGSSIPASPMDCRRDRDQLIIQGHDLSLLAEFLCPQRAPQ